MLTEEGCSILEGKIPGREVAAQQDTVFGRRVRNLCYPSERKIRRGGSMDKQRLESTTRELVPEVKGILAADESTGTITKRFDAVDIESTEESRRQYREMLFTTPGIGEYLSGVILFDETIRQKTSDGKPLSKVLEEQGIIPGIKVDRSTVDLPLAPGEKYTQGLDGLRDR